MRTFRLELYKKPWTMTTHKPDKVIEFEEEDHIITKAESIGLKLGCSEMRLWEITGDKREFMCSGSV